MTFCKDCGSARLEDLCVPPGVEVATKFALYGSAIEVQACAAQYAHMDSLTAFACVLVVQVMQGWQMLQQPLCGAW